MHLLCDGKFWIWGSNWMLERFSKPVADILGHKANFFTQNAALKDRENDLSRLYQSQPPRTTCKLCGAPLSTADFVKNGIGYAICSSCSHLNGLHDDSPEFCAAVYTDDAGEAYGKAYTAEDKAAFIKRRDDIYLPKADFLFDGLREAGVRPEGMSFADFGAGCGYFVDALYQAGAADVSGFEVSKSQTSFGNSILGHDALHQHEITATAELARSNKSSVTSMIGVLEHLTNPREILQALRENPAQEYFYISVPLFSPSVYFEMAFPDVMHRHLSGGHTHLFTDGSLRAMEQEFGLSRQACWWFGSDMVDLYRSLMVENGVQENTEAAENTLKGMILPIIDDMQAVIDRHRVASEVHILYRWEK